MDGRCQCCGSTADLLCCNHAEEQYASELRESEAEVEWLRADQLELADAAIAYICRGRNGVAEEKRLRAAVNKARGEGE
jgi:hypothetical protein